jgi:hypothetical protein
MGKLKMWKVEKLVIVEKMKKVKRYEKWEK